MSEASPKAQLAVEEPVHRESERAVGTPMGPRRDEEFSHPLLRESTGRGFWGTIDRWTQRVAGWLNPILIKEARQSLKSRQFLVTFSLLLLATWFWTVLGIVTNAPEVYFMPTGSTLMIGYYLVLAVPMLGMVPLATHRSLAAELDENTFELLSITRLSSLRIVMGKLNSGMLQMMVYFAAVVPSLGFCYLLRGIDLFAIVAVLIVAFSTALVLTSFGLLMATLAVNRAGQTLSLLGLLAVIIFAEILCGSFCIGDIITSSMGVEMSSVGSLTGFVAVGLTCIVLFIKAAAARIAPVSENRSTGLRWCMFIQQLVWIACLLSLALYVDEENVANMAIFVMAAYWLLMGTLMLAESSELSPRVQRTLPATYFGRVFMTWFNPGSGTGFLFCVASGNVGMFGMAFAYTVCTERSSNDTQPLVMATIMSGYLMGYLGLTRLLTIPISRRVGRSFPLPLAIAVLVLAVLALAPSAVKVATTGRPADYYNVTEAVNWAWTTVEAFDAPFDVGIASLIFLVGSLVFLLNLFFLFREFGYRRVAVPRRVLEDRSVAE